MPNQHDRKLEEEIAQLEALAFGNPDEQAEPSQEEPQEAEQTATETEAEETVSMETTEEQEQEPTGEVTETVEDTQEETTEEPKKERTNWKKRYTNYKAHADATIHQLRQDKIRLKESVDTLTDKIDVLSKTLAEVKESEALPDDLLTQDERDLLGDETISAMEKMQRAMNDKFVKPLQDQLERERELRKKAEAQAVEDDKAQNSARFLAKLEGLVPDYREINVNPSFINYMEEADADSGFTRKYIFKQAEALGDVGRVAQFFKEFKASTNKRTEKLEEKVTPSNSQSSPKPARNEKEGWFTRQEIDAFYDDSIRGAFDGREKERKELEAKIDKAISLGHIY